MAANKAIPASKAAIKEEDSTDSIKTYHTTSTLREMIAKTDTLQKKFASLENKLANIKEGNTEERLTDKIRTYKDEYSKWNRESEESDIF